MKEGTRILIYEITVLLVSIPFIAFITLRSHFFGLSRKFGFGLAFLLAADVLILPGAFQLGLQSEWILSLCVLIVLVPLWKKINNQKKDKLIHRKLVEDTKNINKLETENQELPAEIFEQHYKLETNTVSVSLDDTSVNQEFKDNELSDFTQQNEVAATSLSLDELIDLGFKEKYLENFEKAANYFLDALSLDPVPEIAFYLIIDCFWLWNNLSKRDFAVSQLQAYVQKYFSQFNIELRYQFDAWLIKEDLRNILKE